MRFGPVALADAAGAILAHAVVAAREGAADQGSYRIKKGTELTAQHLSDLAAAGHHEVIVARLDPGDVHEDPAATQLAAALVPDPAAQGIAVGRAGTGRVNLKAAGAGIVDVDARAIAALNAINPMITVATVPPWQRVEPGQMIATVKIIAYAVGQPDLTRACEAARRALRVRPARVASATLIETRVTADTPPDKGRKAMQTRLARFGVSLTDRVVVPHASAAVADALAAAPGEVLMILTGSATSDIADTAPAAVRAAGGTVTHFGMPVDPGNLLFVGALGARPVIGLPGCARSLSMNGADWVLERILCGVPVTPDDIAAMGVGGLLKDIPQRGMLRDATD